MAPIFKIGKMRIHKTHHDFIDQWVSYDPQQRDQRDDLLDAVEIALGVAGVLLPTLEVPQPAKVSTLHEEAWAHIQSTRGTTQQWDPEIGEV